MYTLRFFVPVGIGDLQEVLSALLKLLEGGADSWYAAGLFIVLYYCNYQKKRFVFCDLLLLLVFLFQHYFYLFDGHQKKK